jgi:hypothetical protein
VWILVPTMSTGARGRRCVSAARALLDVGRLALRFVAARVDRAVELVGLDLALHVLA